MPLRDVGGNTGKLSEGLGALLNQNTVGGSNASEGALRLESMIKGEETYIPATVKDLRTDFGLKDVTEPYRVLEARALRREFEKPLSS